MRRPGSNRVAFAEWFLPKGAVLCALIAAVQSLRWLILQGESFDFGVLLGASLGAAGLVCARELARLRGRLKGQARLVDTDAALDYPHPLLELDANWIVRGANPAAGRAFGVRDASLAGLPLRFLIPVLTRNAPGPLTPPRAPMQLPALAEDDAATGPATPAGARLPGAAERIAGRVGNQIASLTSMVAVHLELGKNSPAVPDELREDLSLSQVAASRISLLAHSLEIMARNLHGGSRTVRLNQIVESAPARFSGILWPWTRLEIRPGGGLANADEDLTLYALLLICCRVERTLDRDVPLVIETGAHAVWVFQPGASEIAAGIMTDAAGEADWDLEVCRKVMESQGGRFVVRPAGGGVEYRLEFSAGAAGQSA